MDIREFISKKISIVVESSEKDIWYNNEARRIYNKIKNNIRKIKYEFTSDNDSVKLSNGEDRPLKGIKFNLSQLDKKYNLTIIFAIDIVKNSPHHYDRKNNRIVFFLMGKDEGITPDHFIHYCTLRFSLWVEERIFIHEFIHYLDGSRYTNTYKLNNPQTTDDYYNSSEEYNAYSHEIIRHILNNKNNLAGLPFTKFLKKCFTEYADVNFVKYLTPDYKKKLKSRLYNLFIKINN